VFYFSQKNTDEQNTQGFTETLSQPITQNITANLSWKASVFSVCRRPSVGSKCAPKISVNSVRSVREKTPHCESQAFFSHRFTQKNRTHSHQKPHPQPLSEWRGEWLPRYPYMSSVCLAAHLLLTPD